MRSFAGARREGTYVHPVHSVHSVHSVHKISPPYSSAIISTPQRIGFSPSSAIASTRRAWMPVNSLTMPVRVAPVSAAMSKPSARAVALYGDVEAAFSGRDFFLFREEEAHGVGAAQGDAAGGGSDAQLAQSFGAEAATHGIAPV